MTAEDVAKTIALQLVSIAAKQHPPLGALLGVVLAAVTDDAQKPLADEIRALLPAESASAAALRELEEDRR